MKMIQAGRLARITTRNDATKLNVFGVKRCFSAAPMATLRTSYESPSRLLNYEAPWNVSRERIEKIVLSSREQFTNFYDFQDCTSNPIGFGTFGAVHKCRMRDNNNKISFAVKEMSKQKHPFYGREIEMLKRVSSSHHCLHLKRVLESPSMIFLVTDLLEGGDLFDYIVDNNVASETMTFEECLFLTGQMLTAVEECHLQNFSHLDVKPENFVFRRPINSIFNSDLVLVDFGAAQPYVFKPFARSFGSYEKGQDDLWTGSKRTKITGTISYVSPEIFLHNRFSSRSDVWSLGVSMFMMLTGQRPFDGNCEKQIESMVIAESQRKREDSIFVNHPALTQIKCPTEIVKLLAALTEPKSEDRPSSTEALDLLRQII